MLGKKGLGILFLIFLMGFTQTVGKLWAQTTVLVPPAAALPDNPDGTAGATPPVDSGINLSSLAGAELMFSVFGAQFPRADLNPNFPNGCCFTAEFLDSRGIPLNIGSLPGFDRLTATIFFPIPRGTPPVTGITASTVFNSGPFLVPNGAFRLQFGIVDSFFPDNTGPGFTVTTSIRTAVQPDFEACHAELVQALQIIESLEAELAQLRAQSDQFQAALLRANQTIQSQQAQIAQLQAQAAQGQAALMKANQTIQNQQAQITQLQSHVRQLQIQHERDQARLVGGLNAITTDFRKVFKDPDFQIPANDHFAQYQMLINAILQLNRGRKQGIYKNLGGRRHHDDDNDNDD